MADVGLRLMEFEFVRIGFVGALCLCEGWTCARCWESGGSCDTAFAWRCEGIDAALGVLRIWWLEFFRIGHVGGWVSSLDGDCCAGFLLSEARSDPEYVLLEFESFRNGMLGS